MMGKVVKEGEFALMVYRGKSVLLPLPYHSTDERDRPATNGNSKKVGDLSKKARASSGLAAPTLYFFCFTKLSRFFGDSDSQKPKK